MADSGLAPRIPLGLRRAGIVLFGLVAGPLCTQALYMSLAVLGTGWVDRAPQWLVWAGVLFPPTVIIVTSMVLWARGARWFSGGFAVGTMLWSTFLLWLVIHFAEGMSRFPD